MAPGSPGVTKAAPGLPRHFALGASTLCLGPIPVKSQFAGPLHGITYANVQGLSSTASWSLPWGSIQLPGDHRRSEGLPEEVPGADRVHCLL